MKRRATSFAATMACCALGSLWVCRAVASTPTPPPPWERGYIIGDWLVVCGLDSQSHRYAGCGMRRQEGPLTIFLAISEGPTRFRLRRDCTGSGGVYLEREGVLPATEIGEALGEAVRSIAAEDCPVGGHDRAAPVPELSPDFYVRANDILLLMKSF